MVLSYFLSVLGSDVFVAIASGLNVPSRLELSGLPVDTHNPGKTSEGYMFSPRGHTSGNWNRLLLPVMLDTLLHLEKTYCAIRGHKKVPKAKTISVYHNIMSSYHSCTKFTSFFCHHLSKA